MMAESFGPLSVYYKCLRERLAIMADGLPAWQLVKAGKKQ